MSKITNIDSCVTFFQNQHGTEPPQRVKRSQIPFPVSVGKRAGVLSIMRKLKTKESVHFVFISPCWLSPT
jgi:hypothetical protein